MKSFKPRQVFFAASLAVLAGAFAFACGSNEDVPPTCEGAACIDGGGSEATTPEGSTSDGPGGDSPSDSPSESGDGGACKLQEAGPDGGALQWASSFGTTGYTTAHAVALDPKSGDVVVAGEFVGSVDFGGGLLVSQAPDISGADVFVARFDKIGTYKWAKSFGNGSLTSAIGIGVDASGNVAFGGVFRGSSLDLGGGALPGPGNSNVFLAELDAAGNYRWGKSFGVAGEYQGIDSLALDATGNVFVLGAGATGLDLGGGPLTGYYLGKFTTLGVHAWSKALSVSSTSSNPTLAVDPLGNLLLAGSFSGAANFGGGALTSTGGSEAFLAKYDGAGTYQWARHYPAVAKNGTGNTGSAVSNGALAVDSCGNSFIAGAFGAQSGGATIDFGAGPMSASGDLNAADRFLAKIDPGGKGVWSRHLVGTSPNHLAEVYLGALRVDGAGGATISAVLAGAVSFGEQTSVDFGGGALTNTGVASWAVASFDSAGKHRWSYIGGAPSTARNSASASPAGMAASGGSVVVAGAFGTCTTTCTTSPPGTTLVFAGKTLTAASARDVALASFVP